LGDKLPKSMTSALAALREEFLARLEEQWNEMARLSACGMDTWRDEDFTALHRTAHTIAGSAGLFGLSELERLARRVEVALGPRRATTPEIQRFLRELLAEVESRLA
jgi:HPt (histidine-containing phosphotransfer) domain-containing protein